MERILELTRISRSNYSRLLDSFTIDQLNAVPIGFNNNIIWNIAHIVATMDVLCYRLNGLDSKLSPNFVDEYKKGSSPKTIVNVEFVADLKSKLTCQIELIEQDLISSKFPKQVPQAYMTSFNYELKSIEDCLTFNSIHEALHLGIIMSLKKFV